MADRRYRQPGYGSTGSGQGRREPPPAPPPSGTLKNRSVSRCAACGAVLPITADSLTQCPNCRADLHACRNCAHFETEQRFECTQPVPERIADKSARNGCTRFSVRVTVERDTSSGSIRPEAARRGFGNLFKK
jgi:hypothetical protein